MSRGAWLGPWRLWAGNWWCGSRDAISGSRMLAMGLGVGMPLKTRAMVASLRTVEIGGGSGESCPRKGCRPMVKIIPWVVTHRYKREVGIYSFFFPFFFFPLWKITSSLDLSFRKWRFEPHFKMFLGETVLYHPNQFRYLQVPLS